MKNEILWLSLVNKMENFMELGKSSLTNVKLSLTIMITKTCNVA